MLKGLGLRPQKVRITLEGLIAWCQAQGLAINPDSRSRYASHLYQQSKAKRTVIRTKRKDRD